MHKNIKRLQAQNIKLRTTTTEKQKRHKIVPNDLFLKNSSTISLMPKSGFYLWIWPINSNRDTICRYLCVKQFYLYIWLTHVVLFIKTLIQDSHQFILHSSINSKSYERNKTSKSTAKMLIYLKNWQQNGFPVSNTIYLCHSHKLACTST